MSGVKERIFLFIEEKGISKSEFERSSRLSNGYLNNFKGNLGASKLEGILFSFPELSKDWLLRGEGPMLKSSPVSRAADADYPRVSEIEAVEIGDEEEYQRALAEGKRLIPEYDQDFRGGNRGELLANNSPIGFWQIPTGKADFVVSVSGDSMAPVIPSGAKVCLRPFSFDRSNPNSIPFGNIFAISVADPDTNEMVGYVKHLRRHTDPEMAKRYWIARSVNTDKYDDFDIDIECVHALFVVEHIIIKSF